MIDNGFLGEFHKFLGSRLNLSAETVEWAKTFYLGVVAAFENVAPYGRFTFGVNQNLWIAQRLRPVPSLSSLNASIAGSKTRAIFDGQVEDDLDAVMADTLHRFPQSIQPYLDMIEGQRMDLTWTRYPRFEDLKLYCYRVAGTVGLMTQGVMGVDQAYTSAPWSDCPDTSMLWPWGSPISSPTSFEMWGKIGAGRIYLHKKIERFGYWKMS